MITYQYTQKDWTTFKEGIGSLTVEYQEKYLQVL